MNSLTGPKQDDAASSPGPVWSRSAGGIQVMTGPIKQAPQATPPVAIGLLKAFQRRWRLAIGVGLLVGVMAAPGAWFLLPTAKYTAESLLRVEPEQPRLIATTREYHSDPETDRRTQVTLIKSPIVL